jgi:hypothetical protein
VSPIYFIFLFSSARFQQSSLSHVSHLLVRPNPFGRPNREGPQCPLRRSVPFSKQRKPRGLTQTRPSLKAPRSPSLVAKSAIDPAPDLASSFYLHAAALRHQTIFDAHREKLGKVSKRQAVVRADSASSADLISFCLIFPLSQTVLCREIANVLCIRFGSVTPMSSFVPRKTSALMSTTWTPRLSQSSRWNRRTLEL